MNKQEHDLKLTPVIHPVVRDFLADSNLPRQLMNGLGSPLNILFPDVANDHARLFIDEYGKHNIRGKVFYAHKPNKSNAIVRNLALDSELNIDVASIGELRSALLNGFDGRRIEATGPKSDEFLLLALQHGVLINVDSLHEINRIVQLRDIIKSSNVTPILILLTGFHSTSRSIITKDSRFGITIEAMPDVFSMLKHHKSDLNLIGFSFHIENNNQNEKIVALENVLTVSIDAMQNGFDIRVLNMGGGFQINLLESQQEWEEYVSTLKRTLTESSETSITWNNSGLGFTSEDGVLKGSAAFREHYIRRAGHMQFAALLDSHLPRYQATLADVLNEYMIELYIEPGKAILDQAGITLASVQHVKNSAKGEIVVGLAMNKSNLNSAEIEHMVDPIILKSKDTSFARTQSKHEVYFAGNLCSYSDLIYKHKTFLDVLPEVGDIVVFINTAGYNMDFVESTTLQQPVADKVAITLRDGNFVWQHDKKYTPIGILS